MKPIMILAFFIFDTALFAQELSYHPDPKGAAGNPEFITSSGFSYVISNQVLNIENELKSIDISNIRKHVLGESVAKRMHLFEKTYTYMSSALPGSFSGKKVIQKPGIYNSILRLDKYITQQEKKGTITREQAIGDLNLYLDRALLLFYEDTSILEEELKKAGSNQALCLIYRSIEFL